MLLALENKLSGKPTSFETYCQLACMKEFDKVENVPCRQCLERADTFKQPCGCSSCKDCLGKTFDKDQTDNINRCLNCKKVVLTGLEAALKIPKL